MMSMYYKPYDLQRRFSIFQSCTALGGAFGGVSYSQYPLEHSDRRQLFAFACASLGGKGGLANWRW